MKSLLKLNLGVAAVVIGLMTSCGTNHQASSVNADQSANNIIGGFVPDYSFAQKNGVVGIFDNEARGLCTGSLIHRRLVLTAGHCATAKDPTQVVIFFGADLKQIVAQVKSGDRSRIRRAVNYIRHPNYITIEEMNNIISAAAGNYRSSDPKSKIDPNAFPSMNDIAVYSLAEDAPADFQVAQMPDMNTLNSLKIDTLSFTLAGYGVTTVEPNTDAASLKTEPFKMSGSGTLHQVDGVPYLGLLTKEAKEFAVDVSKGKGSCEGDSGGPAYLKDVNGNFHLMGVTSRGSENCGTMSIYTMISSYSGFINDSANKLLTQLAQKPAQAVSQAQ